MKHTVALATPNEAIIFSGRTRRAGTQIVGYRVVRGGRSLRVPFFEVLDRVDLTNIAIDLEVKGAYSKGGIPLNVHDGSATSTASREVTVLHRTPDAFSPGNLSPRRPERLVVHDPGHVSESRER